MKDTGSEHSHEVFEKRAAARLDDHAAELSGTTTRPERSGAGPKSKLAGLEGAREKRPLDSFDLAAIAEAHQQSVTLNLGGQNVSMSLGDLRAVASDLRNKHGGQDRDKAKAYDGLIRLVDEVANGTATQEDLNEYIGERGLGQEIADAAKANPKITATYMTAKADGAADAGIYADLDTSGQKTAVLDDLFGLGKPLSS